MNYPNLRSRVLSKTPCRVGLAVSVIGFVFFVGCLECSGINQAKSPAPQGKGIFKAFYTPIKNQEYAEAQAEMKKDRVLESIANNLNTVIALPTDITLTLGECGEPNAFYDPQKQRITICYELLDTLEKAFKPYAKTEEQLDDAIDGTTAFVFFHELGHALIHVFDLPVTGKEEDAVDQLSTFILADGTDEGEQSVINGARFFLLLSNQGGINIRQLADEHSLGQQRFYNIICWVYGQDEKKYAGLVKNGTLPKERAERCPGEYEQLEKSWSRLLEPYLKK